MFCHEKPVSVRPLSAAGCESSHAGQNRAIQVEIRFSSWGDCSFFQRCLPLTRSSDWEYSRSNKPPFYSSMSVRCTCTACRLFPHFAFPVPCTKRERERERAKAPSSASKAFAFGNQGHLWKKWRKPFILCFGKKSSQLLLRSPLYSATERSWLHNFLRHLRSAGHRQLT